MQQLFTREGEELKGTPWQTYPRPQMVRPDWLCLNGDWIFTAGNRNTKIRVPFCPESLLSLSGLRPQYGEWMRYERDFTVPAAWAGKRILLHFGAVNRLCEVLVNGKPAGGHDTGYLPFTLDITETVKTGENNLIVRVMNDLSPRYPLGKQKIRRGGMWYTPCSGIWQTVWLEAVPETYVRELVITTRGDSVTVTALGVSDGTLKLGEKTYPLKNGTVTLTPDTVRMWSPEDPYLYRFTLESGEDSVESYFALRTLQIREIRGKKRLCLNGKPYFFHGLLDQGYWSDGLYTPADPQGFERDIRTVKELGFNTLRKHIKIEPEQFYYDCDRLGMIVFQDMVNNGKYRFFRDSALPTARILKKKDRRSNSDPAAREIFLRDMEETVHLLGNHPCICLWTIFNEGWGQFEADKAYDLLKEMDDTRFVDATSGWFHQKKSDVDSLHIYFDKLHLGKTDRAQILSEIGGFACKIEAHSFNPDRTYGYRKYTDREIFAHEMRKHYEEQVLPLIKEGLCCTIWTQVSDVEDETNGMLTYDRKVQKILPGELAKMRETVRQYPSMIEE